MPAIDSPSEAHGQGYGVAGPGTTPNQADEARGDNAPADPASKEPKGTDGGDEDFDLFVSLFST
ncbi:hypothetical protein BDN72DRAFT_834607 [Pluteus cervinus]|uniref:Uncharacterized protein n=1 Tax=Pluteus cervinus TaxID=181527 RepID=A0ACD3B6E1_9AGAR|nr:hypothetical protein BDN72DRAFT_834607 [Pluteus cervinus]